VFVPVLQGRPCMKLSHFTSFHGGRFLVGPGILSGNRAKRHEPVPACSVGGARYAVLLIDAFPRRAALSGALLFWRS
jgi:hypothetical protein